MIFCSFQILIAHTPHLIARQTKTSYDLSIFVARNCVNARNETIWRPMFASMHKRNETGELSTVRRARHE